MRFALLLIPLLTLAACQETGPDTANGGTGPDTCGASGAQSLVGQHRDVLAAMTFPAPMRVIGPNTAVTMDYLPNRLNVIYGEDQIITRVECG